MPDTITAGAALPQNLADNAEIISAETVVVLPAYHKCMRCVELGRTCTGQKLATLGSTEAVRAYHRMLRTARKISLGNIYSAAPQIGHGTINDYFGRGGQDFKWTTVSAIDSALVAICGDRVGLPALENPCPADFTDLRDRSDAQAARLTEAEAEIARLTQALCAAEESAADRLAAQRADLQRIIDLQTSRVRELEAEKADYLARNDDKARRLDKAYAEIRVLNQQIIKMTGDHAAATRDLVDRVIQLAGIIND